MIDGTPPSREEAWKLLTEYTHNPNLLKHGLAVEAAMRHYAAYFKEDAESWGLVGVLHDFDYEMYPSLEDHPYKGQKILQEAGYPEFIRRGIMAHAPHTGTQRETLMEKTIFAVDELAGFIVAVALVKPHKKLAEVEVTSVQKKLKQKGFAAAVKREDIELGAQELNVTLDEHIQHVLTAMKNVADELDL
ncbi:MAG: HAD family hydrolase [Candidatus Andersenbacteria bacterium CG10_big_fil_rev_8_21_14_0_10_54_11]|uniref:HAD family hydrolase n=1 Tax=Candidatus Andersenbacteria bacterium CG10_big_fil_rev_8_21_14_0_10_54_11 TaxID=1974485 RepID=A0A2M6X0D0_9BACT|nr:MAG: HAD family hydrolase [Candidatus Andersenbacteria bacterium CG10_big_fil_rev_8_21_14_0_10_54_11]